jgi:hypothetical protein
MAERCYKSEVNWMAYRFASVQSRVQCRAFQFHKSPVSEWWEFYIQAQPWADRMFVCEWIWRFNWR